MSGQRARAAVAGFTVVLTTTLVAGAMPASGVVTSSRSTGGARAQLAAEINSRLRGSTARHVAFRIDIAGVGSIARNSTSRSAPASNEKLLTSVAAFTRFGPDYRYLTTVAATGPVTAGVLAGDLVLHGSGDPTLTSSDLDHLAQHLAASGMRHVDGHLVVDDTRYNHWSTAPGWRRGFVPDETGPIDAFTVDRNTKFNSGHYLLNPSKGNAQTWRKALAAAQITVAQSTEIGRAPAPATVLASHQSVRLVTLLKHTLRQSDNFEAEMLLREDGTTTGEQGTRQSGITTIKSVAHAMGTTVGIVNDGSGLSYQDRESPRLLVRWLHAAARRSWFPALYDALPVSCETGTLKKRLCGGGVKGRVHAKTGTLDHVRALSGFTTTRTGQQVTFSFLLAGIHDMTAAQAHLDRAVAAIVAARLSP